jgi:hypothetical protein
MGKGEAHRYRKNRSIIQSPASGDMIENTNMNRRWKGEEDLCMVYGLR